MKFILQIFITIIVCAILQYFLPWWTMAIGAAVAGFYFDNKKFISFLAGFAGIALLWLSVAWLQDTSHLLSAKMSLLLPLNSYLLTFLVGGLVGGFSALTGALLRR